MFDRLRRFVFGPPKAVSERALHQLSLAALLAWVGLGVDGLSSSAYGPDEAFRQLGEHTGLAVLLALATAVTVFVISYAYSLIVEHFPSGGGGYVVASLLLGPRFGVVSGAALLVDYTLTITVSIASGGDALFSLLPTALGSAKWPVEVGAIVLLTTSNIRGVKESITVLLPIFATFVVAHAILLAGVAAQHLGDTPVIAHQVTSSIRNTVATLGTVGAIKLFVRAYSLGGGTYTGIEAVSNGVGMMREPRVETAKRTMLLMALSLAITAGGILIAYLLTHAAPEPNKTMNAVLFERFAGAWEPGGLHLGRGFVAVGLLSEAALLLVAAQTGFVDGPRVMANMAIDSWLPHRFAALSERLSMRNGVLLMGMASLAALHHARGHVGKLVVMYAINVFITFSLSQLAMFRFWIHHRAEHPRQYRRHLVVHLTALVLCLTILTVTILEKFMEGGWVTLAATGSVIAICFAVKRHYELVLRALQRLEIEQAPKGDWERAIGPEPQADEQEPSPTDPVLVAFVGGYGGLGRYAVSTLCRMFPGHFKGVVFASVAVVDSDVFKGAKQLEGLRKQTEENLARYERFARSLGLRAASAYRVGTEVAVEAEQLATELYRRYQKAVVVAGQLIFEHDTLWNRLLHNDTAFLIQRRLQRAGIPMIVLPVRLVLDE